jgi:hypothetical protein
MKTFFVSAIRVVRVAANGPLSLTTDASIELSDEQPNCDPEDLEKAVRGLVEAISKTP